MLAKKVVSKSEMSVSELASLVNARVVHHTENSEETIIKRAFASDLMSDVLTLDTENLLLITGLVNPQTIRTAEMSDISTILFVRNKKVNADLIALARESGINLLECPLSMYRVCGILYKAGLNPAY